MKKLALYLLLVFLLANVSFANSFYNNEEVKMDLSINGDIDVHSSSNSYRLQYVTAKLFFYPQGTWRQKVLSSAIEPEAEFKEDYLEFKWEDVKEGTLSFKTDYMIKTSQEIKKISNMVKFPLTEIPDEYVEYTKPTEKIDSDDKDIINLASSMAEGEDDLYIVITNLASWIEDNIKYDLNTLTEDASQKASWVLSNRFGVCDELTNLFIAMVRSLGIPARFISGYAYTEWNDINDWGPHAWAEVYFPSYGWIPFDITYRQFGSIDLSHIDLKQGLDSDEPSTRYEWKGYGVLVKPSDLDIKVKLISTKETVNPLISLKTKMFEENIGFGSYNIVEAEVKNLKTYYMSTELYLSTSKEVEVAGERKKHIVLKPNEIKKVYWMIKIEKDLDRKYVYTFPVGITSLRNITSEFSFYSSKDERVYYRDEMQEILDKKEEEVEKKYSQNVELICDTDRREYYVGEQITIECNIKNTGNTILKDLKLCLKKECKTFNLGIAQEASNNFSVDASDVGKKEHIITVENNEVSKLARFAYDSIDKPRIEVTELEYPQRVSYNDEYTVNFKLVKTSETVPEDIIIDFGRKSVLRTWKMEGLNKDQDFALNLFGKDLEVGENGFYIIINYKDKEGENYNVREDFYVTLSNVNLIQRIIIFFRNLF